LNTKFEFSTGKVIPILKYQGDHHLFNSLAYLEIWPEIPVHSFYIIDKSSQGLAGYARFQVLGKVAISQYKAPFGSLTLSKRIDFGTLSDFLAFITDYFRNIGIREIIIKNYPGFYNPDSSNLVISALGLNGFKVSAIDINHFIEITDIDFASIIHPMEARNLSKCKKAGFKFNRHQNTDAELLFSNIVSFRKIRKIPVNIEFKTIIKLLKAFPDNYEFFSISNGEDIIAGTICVKVNNSVLYNFLPAHNESFNNYSPMIYLLSEIYKYSSNQNYRYLDLGISSVKSTPQTGLIKFKERIGAKSASRLTFIKLIQ
jgi:hypothetical protein